MEPVGSWLVATSIPFDATNPHQGVSCHECNQRLPLRMSQSHEVAALWECTKCGAAFAGVFVHDSAKFLSKNVRLAQLNFETEHAEPIPDAVRHVLAGASTEQSNLKYTEAAPRFT